MSARRGTVWYGGRRVGTLTEAGRGELLFAYDRDWLQQDGFSISLRLPLSAGDAEVDAHAFFEGLLPEGRVRQRVCRQLGVDFADDVGLLLAIGEDCAGALSVLPAGAQPASERKPPRALAAEQIERLVRSHGEDAGALSGEPQRFSLAGAQEKQPVIFDGASYALPDRANPSSHILKFETVPYVCFAEYMANDMARRLGLRAVATRFVDSEAGVPYLRIERYDRRRDDAGVLRRLHQEDLMQALALPRVLKYQREGGPSLGDVAAVLREHTARPVEALSQLRDWQLFNYLIGNSDGHAKNLALLYPPDRAAPVLAPFYDLVAIECLNLLRPGSWARDMAFAVGNAYTPERVTRDDWQALASDLGAPPKRLLQRLEEMAVALPEVAASARRAFAEAQGDAAAYDSLEESVRRRCGWTLQSVFARC